MNSALKTVQSNNVVQAVLFIVLGVILLIFPGITLVMVVYCVGSIFALSGAISLAAYFRESSPSYKMSSALTAGIFLLVVALVMFVFPAAVAGFFSILLGAILILCGVVNTVRSLSLRSLGGSFWIVGVVVGILVVVGGVVVIWNPFDTTVAFVMMLGVLLIVNGVSGLLIEMGVRKTLESGK